MGSLPSLIELLPIINLLKAFDSMSLNGFGSLSDSIGVTIPEA